MTKGLEIGQSDPMFTEAMSNSPTSIQPAAQPLNLGVLTKIFQGLAKRQTEPWISQDFVQFPLPINIETCQCRR